MKIRHKRVQFVYCDYCNKRGHQQPAMQKHEAHCTKNPERVCGVCRDADGNRARLKWASTWEDILGLNICPACSFANARQKSIPVPDEWRLKDEIERYVQEADTAAIFQ